MWLIDTKTLELKYFVPENAPPYAILSHTWGDEEVVFAEFRNLDDNVKAKRGFAKIEKTCQIARDRYIPYAWVDTCCIDKTSSSELSEAINSMYAWYGRSEICYAYIDDWLPYVEWQDLVSLGLGSRKKRPLRWFTRGWTLQELIAPTHMAFYDASWSFKGSKDENHVIEHLSRITTVNRDVLQFGYENSPLKICVAERMRWAAYRQTTRVEDLAYCLLGLFQVNMPLLYGEGDRAFTRLQEEIIKHTTDLSIFAWGYECKGWLARSIFSSHPQDFGPSRGMLEYENLRSQFSTPSEMAITNRGLRLYTEPLFWTFSSGDEVLPNSSSSSASDLGSSDSMVAFIDLGCYIRGTGFQGRSSSMLVLRLRRVSRDLYIRDTVQILGERRMRRGTPQTIYITPDDHISGKMTSAWCELDDANDRYQLQAPNVWPLDLCRRGDLPDRQFYFDVGQLSSCAGYIWIEIRSRRQQPPEQSIQGADQHHSRDLLLAECAAIYRTDKPFQLFMHLLSQPAAKEFTTFVAKLQSMDPMSAEAAMFQHLANLEEQGQLKKSIEVHDASRGVAVTVSLHGPPLPILITVD